MKTVALFVLVAFLGVANADRGDCPDVCPEVYKPVCASDGQEKRVFGNECKMLQYNCQKKAKFNILKFSGDCSQGDALGKSLTPAIIPGFIPGVHDCPDQWNPVCGSDGSEPKTFPNSCIMDVLSILNNKIYLPIKLGPCKNSDMPKSMQQPERGCGVCTKIYTPLCASDGYEIRTFSNPCMLKSFNCKEYRSFVQTRSGECF